jgi:adenine-specific DNA methylase
LPIETNFPLFFIQPLAKAESQRRQFYRPIYSVHKSWARRPGATFRAIGLSHFLEDKFKEDSILRAEEYYRNHEFSGKIVLDPFCGGGTSIVELNRLGVKTIGIDLNPVAWFTTKKELESFNLIEFTQEVEKLTQKVGEQIKSYYTTECPECKSFNADIMYVFWVHTIRCPNCNKNEDLFKYYIVGKKQRKSSETMVICPKCDQLFYTCKKLQENSECPQCNYVFIPLNGNCKNKEFTCSECKETNKIVDILKKASTVLSARQYAIEFYCTGCFTRAYKKISKADVDKFSQIEKLFQKISGEILIPETKLSKNGKNIKNLKNYGFEKFSDLFNKRQLLSLGLLLNSISKIENSNTREYLLAAFSSSLEFHSILCPYNYTMKQIVNIFNYQSFLVPLQFVENNVWGTTKGNGTFTTYLERIKRAKQFCEEPFEISITKGKIERIPIIGDQINATIVDTYEEFEKNRTPVSYLIAGSAVDLQKYSIPDESVDMVLTDPPYYDYIQYSELANYFYVWLRLVLFKTYTCFQPDLIDSQDELGKKNSESEFLTNLTAVFVECKRVLKTKSPLIFTFHHSTAKAWTLILTALKNSHFLITAAFPVHSEFNSRPVKGRSQDFIIICRKESDLIPDGYHIDQGQLKLHFGLKYEHTSDQRKENDSNDKLDPNFAKILPILSYRYLSSSLEEIEASLENFFT